MGIYSGRDPRQKRLTLFVRMSSGTVKCVIHQYPALLRAWSAESKDGTDRHYPVFNQRTIRTNLLCESCLSLVRAESTGLMRRDALSQMQKCTDRDHSCVRIAFSNFG
jgi:hypothetical protein